MNRKLPADGQNDAIDPNPTSAGLTKSWQVAPVWVSLIPNLAAIWETP